MSTNKSLKIKKLKSHKKDDHFLNNFDLAVEKNSIHSVLFKDEKSKNEVLDFLKGEIDLSVEELLINNDKIKKSELKKLNRDSLYFLDRFSAVNPKKDPLAIFKINKKEEKKSTVFPEMTVAENIFFGREPVKSFLFIKSIDKEKMFEKTANLLSFFDLQITAKQKMLELSALEKQLVELLKAISLKVDILFIDQAVIDIDKKGKELFFNFLKKLKEKDITVVYFTKEIEEVFLSSNFVTVLKDGENKGDFRVSDIGYNKLTLLLMGK